MDITHKIIAIKPTEIAMLLAAEVVEVDTPPGFALVLAEVPEAEVVPDTVVLLVVVVPVVVVPEASPVVCGVPVAFKQS